MTTRRFTSADGSPIWSVEYSDAKGMTILLDDEAIHQRFDDALFAYDFDEIVELMNDHRLVAFGTHEGDPEAQLLLKVGADFTDDERQTHSAGYELDGGLLRVSSRLVVSDWAGFAHGCNDNDGRVEGAPVDVEPGDYRVTIYRQFGPEETYEGPTVHLVCLVPVSEPEDIPIFDAIPGADGDF